MCKTIIKLCRQGKSISCNYPGHGWRNNYISGTTPGNYFQNWPHMFSCYQSNLSEQLTEQLGGSKRPGKTMLAVVRLMRSHKQVLELFCLLVSLPLLFINLELHLARLSPHHSSLVAAINTRRVRELALTDLLEGAEVETNTTTQLGQFDAAFREIFSREMEERREAVRAVCEQHQAELQWGREDLEWQMRHKNLWDIKHRVVFCPIAKVRSKLSFIILYSTFNTS